MALTHIGVDFDKNCVNHFSFDYPTGTQSSGIAGMVLTFDRWHRGSFSSSPNSYFPRENRRVVEDLPQTQLRR